MISIDCVRSLERNLFLCCGRRHGEERTRGSGDIHCAGCMLWLWCGQGKILGTFWTVERAVAQVFDISAEVNGEKEPRLPINGNKVALIFLGVRRVIGLRALLSLECCGMQVRRGSPGSLIVEWNKGRNSHLHTCYALRTLRRVIDGWILSL